MDFNLSFEARLFLGGIATFISIIAVIPYVWSILQGQTKPHVFSWIIWGATTFIVFLAQYADGGGAGSWSTGMSGVITIWIAYLAYIKSPDLSITRSDWIFFILALASIPFWYVTSNPLWAVVILTTIDILGYGPTLRKAYHRPYEEQLLLYVILTFRNLISIVALEHFSLTTLLFPVATGLANVVFIAVVMGRRRVLLS